jgi:DNA polymerase-1
MGKSVAVKEEAPVYNTYEDFPPEDLYQYAGVDCLATTGVLNAVFPKVVERKPYMYYTQGVQEVRSAPAILDFMEQVEMPAHEFLIDMEINGIKYDCDLNRKQCAQIEEELPRLEDEIFTLFGSKFNPDSGKELVKILYGDLGFEPPSYTKKNEPSVDGDALSALAETHNLDWLKVLARRNNVNSVYNTFFKTYIPDFVKSDGRVHSSYSLFGTSSFRPSGQFPNMTQIPNTQTENKLGYSIKQCYTVDPGNLFLCLDQSGAEVVMLAFLCRDPKLLRAVAEGKDFHSYSASQMHGVDYDEMVFHVNYEGSDPAILALKKRFKALRQGAKSLTFGILYGSSVRGIAHTLNITEQEATRLIAMYFKEFPLIEVYVNDSHAMAKANNYVMNMYGQSKKEFGAMNIFRKTAVYNAALRNSQNVRCQSSSAVTGLYGFSKLNEAVKPMGAKVLTTVYDSLAIEVPYHRMAEAINTAFYVMEDLLVETFEWMDFPIRIDVEAGINWKQVATVHRGITQPEVEILMVDKFGRAPMAA